MLFAQLFNNLKVIPILLFLAMMVGCGGGASAPTADNTGTAELSWVPPTTYTDGSSITELGGYNIYINTGNGFVKFTTINNPGVSTYTMENMSPGTYTFAITAFDGQGIESSFSTEANITI
jgi:hypothetical protein